MSTHIMARTPIPGPVEAGPQQFNRLSRFVLPTVGVSAVVLSAVGVSGVGDAPDPHDPAAAVTTHFVAVHDDVLLAAPIGYLGATLLGAFVFGLATRLGRMAGGPVPSVLRSSGVVVALYFATLHVVYTTLSYQVAAGSPEAAKALFVSTILLVPVYGVAVAMLLAAAAYGAWHSGAMPRWWSLASAAMAPVAALAAVSFQESGFFYPDVQQQVVSNLLFVWVLATAWIVRRPVAAGD